MEIILQLIGIVLAFIWLARWLTARQFSADAQAALEQLARIRANPSCLVSAELIEGTPVYIRIQLDTDEEPRALPFVQGAVALRVYAELIALNPSAELLNQNCRRA